jgi:hypothetical protein
VGKKLRKRIRTENYTERELHRENEEREFRRDSRLRHQEKECVLKRLAQARICRDSGVFCRDFGETSWRYSGERIWRWRELRE